ncbi:pre-mRNA-processing ATP-dependent RNA helicase PRP5 [Kwoniella bestiolae CBS 10118]|uniref:RNA helicase n=1 Tax=Kwoniella bestiolae CBS 10118 TaxID=1296100 RepID=A0A1B9FSI4_9TREE|nr:pre-mRNA-processing ATP-dependent RNA helicase PRP5 [Kwoniella bestiolae CBS 10118]OCF21736.1 pre-mRNA-processing ATP-dependent RNA helicase PRP5 [Kwoniella bestiolae CBS 10118]
MPRSPRRSRSPEGRRSSHRGGHRSPSPSASGRYERSYGGSSSRRSDDRKGSSSRYEDDDRHYSSRDRERERDRYRDRSRERERYRGEDDSGRRRKEERDDRRHPDNRRERDRSRDRERDDRSHRRDEPRSRIRTRSPSPPRKSSAPLPAVRTPLTDNATPTGSPAPETEEDKKRKAKERLEAWKKQRALKEGKTATPEPASVPSPKPASPARVPIASTSKPPTGLPNKPTAFSLSRIGLPLKAGTAPTPLKRSLAASLDDDDESSGDRKLQKLGDLPEINPDVQSGGAAEVEEIGDDLAVEDIKPTINGNGNEMDVDEKPQVKEEEESKIKVDEEEEEEDPLDAFMRTNVEQVVQVNQADARRMGLRQSGDDSDNEEEEKVKVEDKLAEAEALLQQAAAKSRKKDLPPPDHSKIDYEPFQKAFYNPPPEVLEMDEEDAELLRLEMDGIKIRGQDAPRPVKNWGAFGLPTGCLDVIRHHGWATPTSIQAQAIPAIMSGRDVIGIAKTGSGKTVAFLLPMFRHVRDQRPVSGSEGPIAVVMSPTRELATQIYKECQSFLKVLNIRVTCCVGGSSISEDIAAMKKGAEVVVCTPGRMIDLLTANNGRVTNLRRTTYIVMDEADRMFDMGFEPQVMKIINNVRPDAQKVLFSATFPKTMESLARKILIRPLEITVGGRSVVAPEIDQRVEVREPDSKFNRLLEILGEMGETHKDDEDDFRTLIFVDRQESADDLFRDLLQRGYVCASLHGGKEQVDRDEAIKNFKSGDVPIIVATSVAARGLDVKELKLVINYDCPNHMEDYVHRAGRTGRAGNTGTCITFITPAQEKFSVDIVRALDASKAFIPDDLKAMSENFLGKIKSGKARAAGSGFAGKGLERIERKRAEKDQAEKHTYGDTSEALSLSSREGAVIPYKPKTTEFKQPENPNAHKGDADYTFTEIKVEVIHGPAPDRVIQNNPQTAKVAMAALPAQTIAALEKAKKEGRTVDAANLAKVVARLTQSIELTKAEKLGLAQPVNSNGVRTKDPDATDYHAIFPINDYPQKARWKATNKEQMTLLQEISGASITMKGLYYPPGSEPGPGDEPKLSLLIESNDEHRVRAAVDEIRRNLVEASVAALNTADRAPGGSGRYAV